MKRLFVLSLAMANTLLLQNSATAQTVATDPVGFTTVSCLGNSDTFVSIPFTRPAEYVGAIASGPLPEYDSVSGTPWTVNQFVYAAGTQPKRYYVLIGPAANPKEGHTYFINSNTNNQLTVDTTQDNLTGIPSNGTVQLVVIPELDASNTFPSQRCQRFLHSDDIERELQNAASNSELRRRRD